LQRLAYMLCTTDVTVGGILILMSIVQNPPFLKSRVDLKQIEG
jgi:hypothetical protein